MTLLYVAVNAVFLKAIPAAEMAGVGEPAAVAATRLFGSGAAFLIALGHHRRGRRLHLGRDRSRAAHRLRPRQGRALPGGVREGPSSLPDALVRDRRAGGLDVAVVPVRPLRPALHLRHVLRHPGLRGDRPLALRDAAAAPGPPPPVPLLGLSRRSVCLRLRSVSCSPPTPCASNPGRRSPGSGSCCSACRSTSACAGAAARRLRESRRRSGRRVFARRARDFGRASFASAPDRLHAGAERVAAGVREAPARPPATRGVRSDPSRAHARAAYRRHRGQRARRRVPRRRVPQGRVRSGDAGLRGSPLVSEERDARDRRRSADRSGPRGAADP